MFCYDFGYVITLTDPDLTKISCMTSIDDGDLLELTNKPDVKVAGVLMETSLVYVDTLALCGFGKLHRTTDKTMWPNNVQKPPP